MQEKYGFVYIWYDRKHKRYYIGAHWGTEDDGYICSSKWMKQAYRKRLQDFKRRILARIYTNKKDTFMTEHKWLQMIKKEELKKKYYNIMNSSSLYWLDDEIKVIQASKKISEKLKEFYKNNPDKTRLGKKSSLDTRQKQSKSAKGKAGTNKGKKFDKSWKNNMSETRKQYLKENPYSQESREQRSKTIMNSKWMKNIQLNVCKQVKPFEIEEYLNNNWILGRLKRK